MHGAVCLERQLDTAFLMGLRVHPQHFGRGIATRLTVGDGAVQMLNMIHVRRSCSQHGRRYHTLLSMMPSPAAHRQEAAEVAARDLPGVSTLQTATIMANGAVQAILAKRGWQVCSPAELHGHVQAQYCNASKYSKLRLAVHHRMSS